MPQHDINKKNASFISKTVQKLPLASVSSKKNYHWFVVSTVCVGAFMAALDASIVNIALPQLQKQFHVPMNVVEWISLVYLLTLAALIVPFGRIADMFGRRWMYAFGFFVFMIGSFLCGIAESLTFLLFSVGIQGIGAAMLQANSVAIVTAATPPTHLGKAIGIQGSAQAIGLSLGPALGGALLSFVGWRWIFFINIPIGIFGTMLGILLLPRDEHKGKREPFDFAGACTLIPGLVALIYFLNNGLKRGWTSPVIIASYIIAVIGFSLFIVIERRSKHPMVDLSLFKIPVFTFGNMTGIMSFAVMYAISLLSPYYLDSVQGLTSFQAGLYMTAIPIGMMIFTPIAGTLADKFGARILLMFGMVSTFIGCILLAVMPSESPYLLLIAGLFCVGVGLGVFTPPNNSSVMGSAPKNRLGVAGGVLNMARTLGMGLGVTFGGLTYQLFVFAHGGLTESETTRTIMVSAFKDSFYLIAALAALTFFISSVRRGSPKRDSVPTILKENA